MKFLRVYPNHQSLLNNPSDKKINISVCEDGPEVHYGVKLYDAKIEYLESTGTQYIDTGIFANQYPFKLETLILFTNTSSEKDVWGNINKSQGDKYGFVSGVNGSSIYQWGGSSWKPVTCSINNWYTITYEYDTSSHRKCIVNNTTYNSSISNNNIINSSTPIYLFCDGARKSYFFYGKIKYAKIYINNNLVMDLIPVRVGTTGYMYDKVSGQLFSNNGTGSFTLGQDI